MRSVRISAWYLPVIDLSSIWTTGAVVGVGGWLVHRGDITIGTVAAFILLLSNLFEPIQQLSQLFNLVQSAGAALNKLYGAHRHADRRARPEGAEAPQRVGNDHGRARVVRATPAVRRCCATCRSPSSPGSGWRSSAPPAPASRRSPS